ncbi:hypothetical protein AUP68_08446 [Ilyonectria robusta]
MDNARCNTVPAKRKRGRPRKYSTSEAKAAADVERRRARRQDAAPVQCDTVHANFHNSVFPLLPLQSEGGTGWVNVFSGSYSPANPTDALELDNADISQFLPPADPQPPEDIEEQAISDAVLFVDAVDSGSIPNLESPGPDITFDMILETSPEAEDHEYDPVRCLV